MNVYLKNIVWKFQVDQNKINEVMSIEASVVLGRVLYLIDSCVARSPGALSY